MDRVLAQFEEVAPVPTATPGAAAWTAREAGGGRRVLIKRLGGAAKTRATQSLALRHPRIVPTRRWLTDGDGFYVVRDWVPGRNLRQSLSDLSLRAFDRLHARLLPLLDALDYAHASGLTHGAVTPENVVASEEFPEFALLCDFAGPRPAGGEGPRRDFAGLCGLYRDFLPARPADDEAGAEARARLLRNLSEIEQTALSADELRYKLDAVARMAGLLGFNAADLEAEAGPARARLGSRLVCTVTPPTALLTPGGGTQVTLALDNEGDSPLHLESVVSDVVWLNLPNGFTPVDLAPGTGGDLLWTVSGARLAPGAYSAALTVRSSDGLVTTLPPAGTAWPEQKVAVPVLVRAQAAGNEGGPEDNVGGIQDSGGGAVPLAERLPHPAPPGGPPTGDHPGIACVQEPDPGLVRGGQSGVVHLGVRNTGPDRLRIDRIHTRPHWLSYPGDLRAVWIEPGATQFLGFALDAAALAGGDYVGHVTFTTSTVSETMLGPKPVWRDMGCEVRVRVVRGAADALPRAADILPGGLGKAGCLPAVLALASSACLLLVALRIL